MKRWSLLLALLLCASLFLTTGFTEPAVDPAVAPAVAAAQDDSGVTVDTARPVTEVVNEKNAYLATVSPDGSHIAWGKQSGRGRDRVLQLCLFEFESAAKGCSDLSVEVFDGYPYQFQWSPDSRYIAFSENPVQLGSESDIWLFDTESQTFTDLTDDGLVGSWNALRSGGDQVKLDLLPMWNNADGQLYFWRVVPLGNMRFTIGLYRIVPDGGDAELVRDLTADFAAQAPLFDYEELFLDGMSAIAPNGNTLAVLMTSFDEFGSAEQKLWTLDLTDAASKPQQMADADDFRSALPEWAQDFPPQAQGLSWTGDGAGIVVLVNSAASASMPFQVYYYVELDGRAITPVVDFSGLEEMDSYGDVAEGSDLPWRAYSPWTGSLTSAGDKLLMVNDLAGETAVLVAPLPPTGALPAVAASAETISSGGSPTASRGEGGKVLVYGNLLTITEP